MMIIIDDDTMIARAYTYAEDGRKVGVALCQHDDLLMELLGRLEPGGDPNE